MQSKFLLCVLCATAGLAIAVPSGEEGIVLRRAEEVHLENLPIVDLEVTDDRFPGLSLHGTVDKVYKELLELHPEAFGDKKGDLKARSLEKRSYNCGWGGNKISWGQCIDGMTHLMNLDRAWCVVGPRGCARVSCSHGCAMFLCNKLDAIWRVACGDIASDVRGIQDNCGGPTFSWFKGARDFNTHFIGVEENNC
ncbi:hypothetical protein BKA66DRAFT_223298 [Pyrenochaeta sp. MPI-SDFR-AT-0127]|nr:hypothetical protein BKA66DRAFT_223298 [Pyrenochaeta sp. MPI-SDFR-AT-0127]